MQQAASSTPNKIEELLREHGELMELLRSSNQLTMMSSVETTFGKTLVVAVASYFEVRLTEIILDLYREATREAEPLVEFVGRQAIGRRFAQLFNWDEGRNANGFYRLFGDGFAASMRSRVGSSQELSDSVRAFLEIGELRNQMVHKNFADFQLTKTVDEVYSLYRSATLFLEEFPAAVRQFAVASQGHEAAKA